MKVTIDSTEPLQDALRVIGALYDVTLTQAEPASNAATTTTRTTRTRKPAATADRASAAQPAEAAAPRSSGRRARLAPTTAAAPKTSDIRAWAQANGHQISDRGPLPAAVIAEYRQLHPQG